MTIDHVSKMVTALNKLGSAIDAATASLNRLAPEDTQLVSRVDSYKEIVRRQRKLLYQLACAYQEEDWSEVNRLTNLVQQSSLMIKVDASFIVSALKSRGSAAFV
jgi:hypothetical protein